MTIKWNWGTKIFLVYVGFVVFMLTMVYLCTIQHFDLVSSDYYAQELRYQEVIDGEQNLQALGKSVTISTAADAVTVTLPVSSFNGTGEVKFYRPDNAKFDVTMPMAANGTISVPRNKLAAGRYEVKTSWTNDGKPYYHQQAITVAP